MSGSSCGNCGAPFTAGLAACSFCETPYPGARAGVACPKCGDINEDHNPRCASCKTALVQGCIFCGAASPLTVASCVRCHEAFAGAADRKKAREEQQRQQQILGVASQGVSVLGQFATSPTGRGLLGQLFTELVDEVKKSS